MQKQGDKQAIVEEILSRCPGPVISRRQAAIVSGGMIGERSLANIDSNKEMEGPAERVRVGRRVGYTSKSFAVWLADRIKTINTPPAPTS